MAHMQANSGQQRQSDRLSLIAVAILAVASLTVLLSLGACGAQPPSGIGYVALAVTPCSHELTSQLHLTAATHLTTAASGSIYITTQGGDGAAPGVLYALAASNGALRWCESFYSGPVVTPGYAPAGHSYPPPPSVFPSAPTVANGVVYLTLEQGAALAFDAASGKLLWQRRFPVLALYAPTYANGALYVIGGPLSSVYALDAATGAIRWQWQATSQTHSGSPVTVADGIAYVNTVQIDPGGNDSDYALYALDATTGAVRWRFATARSVDAPPVVAGGMVYIGAGEGDGHIYALDARSGRLRWKYATNGAFVNSDPTVGNGLVYADDVVNPLTLLTLDAATGTILRQFTLNGITQQSTPLVGDGAIYLAGQGVVVVNAATGRVFWSNPLDYTHSDLSTPAILSGAMLYVACNDGTGGYGVGGHNQVVALEAHTGQIFWTFAMPGSPNTPALG